MYTCVPNSPYSDLDAGPSDPHPEPEPYDYHMLDTPILFMFWGALSTCIENMCPSFFGFFFSADCDTKLPVCLRSARCVSEPTFLDFFDHYEQDSAHISSTTSFSSGWLTEWKRDVVSEVLNYSFSSLATQNSFIGIFFFPQLGQKNGIFSACKLGRCRSRHTRTLSHTSYIVLWLDFRAGRGDAALGRVLGVLFHQLQTGRLGDAAGHPGTTNTLREREKGRKK